MLVTLEGIIVRTVKYSESSLILDIFSADLGIQSYIISGVRSSKKAKSKASMLQVLNLVRFVAYQKEGEKLSRIKEVAYSYVYRSIPFSVVKSSIAIFLVEVCRKSVRGSDSYEDIYNFMVKGLIHLDNTNSGLAHFHILFLIDLAGRLGFELQNNYTTETQLFNLVDGSFTELVPNFELAMDAESSYCLSRYLKKQEPYNWSKQMRLTILQKLIDYYRYHVDDFGELKSYTVLSELYN